ncbi:endonuclease III [Ktedonobacter sp. SOSP1-52]|uniref:endonuclease III n=1 Tax=Ktedonobacter sp. SOSP1-52 TaxID=2778366 RepID=UPI0019161C4A|nr:endonuclease III [Ktedonobacter sp. SOSP1-52]GHO66587.1 endonuclease III [Ktedonobacter sp. SOSP1-52]
MSSSLSSGVQVGSGEQVQAIIDELYRLYPQARYELDFTTPLELFVATQLAAQCTDERVNAVTKTLFQKYRSAADYAGANQEELEQDVKQTGFYRKKANQLRVSCQYLLDHYGGEVPRTMAELVRIPGIARKTANVILGNAFGVVDGFIVDTHVDRLSKRFGWSNQNDIVKIEGDLMALMPREHWMEVAHRIIYHGRAVCNARKPLCAQCTLASYCPSAVLDQ